MKAIDTMVKTARDLDLDAEGWDEVLEPEPVRMVTPKLAAAVRDATVEPAASDRTLGFGLLVSRFDQLGGAEAMAERLAGLAAEAERAGFESLWVMDHMIQIPQVGSRWDPMLESYSTLAFLTGATSTIRLGVLVTASTFRNVGHLGKTIATLDVLSGGRAIAGLGAANSADEHEAYGWPFPPAADRLARLDDVLTALPLLWGPGNPRFDGRTFSLPDTTCYPRPLQDPVPIVVGGSGEKVTLRLAAEHGAACNLFGDVDAVRRRAEVYRGHWAAAGRDPNDAVVTHLGEALVGHDPRDLDERIGRLRPANVGPDRYAARVNAGTVDDHEARFRQLSAAGVDTAIVSTPDLGAPDAMATFERLIERFADV